VVALTNFWDDEISPSDRAVTVQCSRKRFRSIRGSLRNRGERGRRVRRCAASRARNLPKCAAGRPNIRPPQATARSPQSDQAGAHAGAMAVLGRGACRRPTERRDARGSRKSGYFCGIFSLRRPSRARRAAAVRVRGAGGSGCLAGLAEACGDACTGCWRERSQGCGNAPCSSPWRDRGRAAGLRARRRAASRAVRVVTIAWASVASSRRIIGAGGLDDAIQCCFATWFSDEKREFSTGRQGIGRFVDNAVKLASNATQPTPPITVAARATSRFSFYPWGGTLDES
jgi:hypothetical protein